MEEARSQKPEVGILMLPAFGMIEARRVVASDELFAVIRDGFPVSPGHMLIIPRRAVQRFAELTEAEKARLMTWVTWAQDFLSKNAERKPDGFNLGVNDGTAAGQTMPQFHFHVIPRYAGDVADPRGGVRWVKPDEARYWCEAEVENEPIEKCTRCLKDVQTSDWMLGGCLPVSAFGDAAAMTVEVATVGLNPSATEFFIDGKLKASNLRLAHLADFQVPRREKLETAHIENAVRRRMTYFSNPARNANPWFTNLRSILEGCEPTWGYDTGRAVHIDVVACATAKSWSELKGITAQVTKNCRTHFVATVNSLSLQALLLCDGTSACDAVSKETTGWIELLTFTDRNGQSKRLRVRSGLASNDLQNRRFFAWNYPANWLPDEALVRVAEWLRTELHA
jgi:diadenosine tetraphosphate (Ap4A) HIT family hydrolase